ncbi:MAG: FmdB family zinc ribbon protein [bacterium]
MPILEFSCNECHNKFEDLILKKEEMGAIMCPHCRGRNLTRLCSTFGFRNDGKFSNNSGSSCTGCSLTSCAGCFKEKEAR